MSMFVFYDAGTGAIAQVSEGHEPFERDGYAVAIFTNKTFAEAAGGLFIVDLSSVDTGGTWDTAELIDNPSPPEANFYAGYAENALIPLSLEVNGDHRVTQQWGTTEVTGMGSDPFTTYFYPSDIQFIRIGQTTARCKAQIVSDAPPGFERSLKITVTTTVSPFDSNGFAYTGCIVPGDRIRPLQWGTAQAVPLSLGEYWKSSVAGRFYFNFESFPEGGGDTNKFGGSADLEADTWTWVAYTSDAITDGVWLTREDQVGIRYQITLAPALGDPGDQLNFFATASATFQRTGLVMLVGGSGANPASLLAYRRQIDDELFLCQRQWQKSFRQETVPANNVGYDTGEHVEYALVAGANFNRWAGVVLSPPLARTPLVGGYVNFFNPAANNSTFRDRDAGQDFAGGAGLGWSSSKGFSLIGQGHSSTSVGNRVCLHWTINGRIEG